MASRSMMARFRNLLVYRYADIDAARVWTIVADDLGDLDELLRVAGGWIEVGADESPSADEPTD